MIWFYSGTPGSGKSLHAAQDIYNKLVRKKQDVIASFPINMDYITKKGRRKTGRFIYKDISDLTVEYLITYAKNNHSMGKEGQTLVIIDECQIMFNPREFNRNDRLKWITFFTQHRKLGYNFILISQFDRLVDRQIRALFEYDIKHRKVNNFGIGILFPFKTFVAVNYWYGVKERIGCEFFIYKKMYSKIYDSYLFFEESVKTDEKQLVAEDMLVVETGIERSEGVPVSMAGNVSKKGLFYRIVQKSPFSRHNISLLLGAIKE